MMDHENMQHPAPDAEEAQMPVDAKESSKKPSFFREVLNLCCDYLYDYSWVMLLVATVLIIAYYVWFPSRYYFHSDTTDTLMWAEASYDAGALFNKEFAYACLLPFGTSLIMTALIPIFGVSMTTHVLGMLIFFLLFTAALIFLLRRMGWSWKWVSVGVFIELMTLSGSEKLREIFWGHTIYYSLGVLFLFVGLGLVFRCVDLSAKHCSSNEAGRTSADGRKLVITFILLCVWYVLTSMNQLNAMTIFALPLMGALFLERFLDNEIPLVSKKNCSLLLLLVVLGGCMALGYFLTHWLSEGIYAGYAESYSAYSAMDEWVSNLQKFPMHWFSLLGVTASDGDPFLSEASIINLLIIFSSIIFLVLPAVGLCCYRKIEDVKLRILLLTYWCMTLLILMGYICGRLSSANWRLSPIAAMAVVVSIAVVRWASQHVSMQRIMAVSMIPVILVCMITSVRILQMPAANYHDALLYRLADALEDRGLTYGYATFWQANGITVVSDSEVKCRNVTIDENGISPYVYQSSDSWFDDQFGQEKYFLLLTEQERRMLMLMRDPVTQLPHTEDELCEMFLWTFEENIFQDVPEEFLMPEDVLAPAE